MIDVSFCQIKQPTTNAPTTKLQKHKQKNKNKSAYFQIVECYKLMIL